MRTPIICLLLFITVLFSCSEPQTYDVIIRNGQLYDGSGSPAFQADIGILGDSIVAIGDLDKAAATMEIDASGMAVAPGFINMLSWANVSLIEDGRSQGDIRQGVTLEVLGEGRSMGPLNDEMKAGMKEGQQNIKYDIAWTTLGEYLDFLEQKGVSTNIASFVGNGTLREYVMGYEKRTPTNEEMDQMKALLRQAMEEGAVGMSTSLIYVPSGHAQTDEIIELAKVVSEYDGMYISHIRDEEGDLLEAVQELIRVSDEADVPAEIYHFKASGNKNWHLLDDAIALVDSARNAGLNITTDMYMYNASSTGLNVLLPEWAKEGGHKSTMALIEQPDRRLQMMKEVDFYVPPENILLVGFRNEELRSLLGKTLAEVAEQRDISPEEAIVDLIYEDNSRIQVVYFSMTEENIEKKLALPYMAICSDAGSYTNEGVFTLQSTHPRAYGSFARLLGHYVRDKQVIPLEEAIYKLTSLPATNLKLERRGALLPGYYADIVIFNPETIQDQATFEKPHQYATGVEHVFVNGLQVLKNGEHTGAFPGRVVRGPGWNEGNDTSLIREGAELKLVSDAYSFTEGPAVDTYGNVYFTDQPNNQILKWSVENEEVGVFMKPAGRANGLYFDNQGKLLAAADEKFELWRIDVDKPGEVEVLLSQFEGKNLNGPNDIWVGPKGGIYFTDPYYQRPWWDRSAKEIEQERVYYLPKGSREPVIVVDDFVQPNGIIGSADGKKLYIADIGDKKTYSYDIRDNGMLTNKKLLAPMGSDGMTLDIKGNLYLTGNGVTVFNPEGKKILHIPVPQDWTANVTFGGKDQKTLFITAMNSLYTLDMNVNGIR
ncbi:SMP-30/gluconolactonase/LRE family protein [Flavobacteriaceae bacterium D16]|nr:SMP-30/gluconolactonase/LRE family protein [Flavobacteriaceae bacterium D16]